MAFWAYMLHCRGGYFYVGHTDDLERPGEKTIPPFDKLRADGV